MRKTVIIALLFVLTASFWGLPTPAEATDYSTPPFRVYLTFEDGPTGWYTPGILDILADYNAKATFFVNGYQIEGHEWLLQRMIAEGHTIGNHLWHEEGHYYGYPDEDVYASYLQTEAAIRTALGDYAPIYDAQTKLFRFPGGGGGAFPALGGEQVITYNWHVSGNDCGSDIDEDISLNFDQQVLRNVLGEAQPAGIEYWNVYEHGDGAIIVLHDINRVTARVLPTILEELSAAGATFHALPRPQDPIGSHPVVLGQAPTPTDGIPGVAMTGYAQGTIQLRQAPSTDAPTAAGNIPDNTPLTLVGRNRGYTWYLVDYNGTLGWAFTGVVDERGPVPQLPVMTE